MDPQLEHTLIEWMHNIMIAAERRGSQATEEFTRRILMTETVIFADTELPRQAARKRLASELGPSCWERPEKRRKLGREFWEVYTRCLFHVDSQLKKMGVLLGKRLRVTRKLTEGFEEIMNWEEELSRGTDLRRNGSGSQSCAGLPPRRRWRAA